MEESTSRQAALESSIREVLFQIIRFVNEKKDHLPSIPNHEGISFPYEITIQRSVFIFISYFYCRGTNMTSILDVFA